LSLNHFNYSFMPQMNHNGPEGKGPMTGRKLGLCRGARSNDTSLLGKGMGQRRKMGGGQGLGKRLKYDLKNNGT
jgi:hypothetical protein